MSVIYSAAAKTARMNAVVTAIGASGKLKIKTSGDVVLATIPLAATAGTVSGAVLTLSAPISDTAADGTGTAAKATITTSGDVDVITGLTVSTTGADINLDSVSITTGQTVTITTGTITHAA